MNTFKVVLAAVIAGLLLASSSVMAGKPSTTDCPCAFVDPIGWYGEITAVDEVEAIEYDIYHWADPWLFTRSLEVTHDGGDLFRIYTRENWHGYACGYYNPTASPSQWEQAPLTETEMKACDYMLVRSRNLLEEHFSPN